MRGFRIIALIKAWASFTITNQIPIIVGSTLLLLTAMLTGKAIPSDNSTERYFVASDPPLLEYDSMLELFGDNEYLVVGFEAPSDETGIFNADTVTRDCNSETFSLDRRRCHSSELT